MSEVRRLDVPWYGPIPVPDIIEGAGKANYEDVLVIGFKDDEVQLHSNLNHKADVLWLLEKVKADLLRGRW